MIGVKDAVKENQDFNSSNGQNNHKSNNNEIKLKDDDYSYVTKKSWLPRFLEDYYQIEYQVGQGTYGDVFKARKLKSSSSSVEKTKYYALKEFKLLSEKQEGFPITAIREITILNELDHENIIHIKEIVLSKESKTRDKVFVVFDFMDYDLSGMLRNKILLTLPQIKNIIFQISQGLNYMHKSNYVHRDIKSANILLNKKGEIKIADFGLARQFQMGKKQPLRSEIVTLWYRAPELLLSIYVQ
jgi:serine/threonine protein kinase